MFPSSQMGLKEKSLSYPCVEKLQKTLNFAKEWQIQVKWQMISCRSRKKVENDKT